MQLCTSKHTSSIILSVPACIRSLARCPEFKVVVAAVMDESPRRQARQASLKLKACAVRPTSRNAIRHLPRDGHCRRCVSLKQLLAVLHSLASALFIRNRLVLGIANGCRSRNRPAPLDVDIYILDFLAHKHARTLMTDDGWNFLDAV